MAEFLDRGISIAIQIQAGVEGRRLSDFVGAVSADHPDIAELRRQVEEFARKFPTIGYDVAGMKHSH